MTCSNLMMQSLVLALAVGLAGAGCGDSSGSDRGSRDAPTGKKDAGQERDAGRHNADHDGDDGDAEVDDDADDEVGIDDVEVEPDAGRSPTPRDPSSSTGRQDGGGTIVDRGPVGAPRPPNGTNPIPQNPSGRDASVPGQTTCDRSFCDVFVQTYIDELPQSAGMLESCCLNAMRCGLLFKVAGASDECIDPTGFAGSGTAGVTIDNTTGEISDP